MFTRAYAQTLEARLREPLRFIQVVAGPRQVGKTTLVRAVLEPLGPKARFASADEPALKSTEWIAQQWEVARAIAKDGPAVLALDEIQKVTGWSEAVKRLWDEDRAAGRSLQLVLLGSAPLALRKGLTESLAGRFEVLHLPHWTFSEMRAAFGWDLERFLYFGAYPGAAPLVDDPPRWVRYIKDALIETTIARDVLLLTRVDKPALLRRLFDLACRYSGQILSYQKMTGQLKDAGNTTTLAHYLDLLAAAGMVTGFQKFSGSAVRQRGSSPKLQVLNTALLSAQADIGPADVLADATLRGRLVESAVGAHLANAQATGLCEVFYWRERNREVDFVVRTGRRVTAVEVKSGRVTETQPGMTAFREAYPAARPLLVGGDGVPLDEFLGGDVERWVG